MNDSAFLTLATAWNLLRKLYAEGDKLHAEGNKLRAEGNKLRAEGDNLHAEGAKLYAEGDKLYAEGDKLHAEGRHQWVVTILARRGNVKMEWVWRQTEYDCVVEGVTYSHDRDAVESCCVCQPCPTCGCRRMK